MTRRNLLALTASLLLACNLAGAATLRRVAPIPGQAGVATADEAASNGLSDCAEASTTQEYAGAVYEVDGVFFHTSLVTSKDGREVGAFTIALPRNAKLVALFHTHPRDLTDDQSEFFSPADVRTAKDMQVPSYVGIVKSGHVIEFDPRRDAVHVLMDSAHVNGDKVANGHKVGVFVVPQAV